MSASVNDLDRLTALSKSKAYRDAYLSGHVRSMIAYQMQALREKLGLSQSAFADKVRMKQSVISRLENPEYGKVTIQTLLQVASALNIGLLVRFCSYPEFIKRTADTSPEALEVQDVDHTIKLMAEARARQVQPTGPEYRIKPLPFLVGQQPQPESPSPSTPTGQILTLLGK